MSTSTSFVVDTAQELQDRAKTLTGTHFFLYGDMWSGKTTFAQWFCEQLNIARIDIQSPTYTYYNVYDNRVLHIDMRRLQEETQLYELGLLEAMEQYPYILIERPKREKVYQQDFPRQKITFLKTGDNSRKITRETTITSA